MSQPTNGARLLAIALPPANHLSDVPSLLALASDALNGAASIADDLDSQERLVAATAVVGVLPGGPVLPVVLAESLVPHQSGGAHGRPAMRHVRLGKEVDALLEGVARLHDGNTTNALRAAVRVLAELYRVPITAPTLALEGLVEVATQSPDARRDPYLIQSAPIPPPFSCMSLG